MADEVVQERAKNFLEQGQSAARAGQRELARRYLQAAVDIDPDNVDAWLWLAGVQDDPHNVKRSLEKVLELNPSNKRAKQGLKLVEEQLAEQGEEQEAVEVEPERSQSIEQSLRDQLRQSSDASASADSGGRPALAEPADDTVEESGISLAELFSGEDVIYRAITLALLALLLLGIIIFVLLALGVIAPIA